MTEVRYQFWDAPGDGETWAVRIEGGVVTGASGPLCYTEVVAADLPSMEYDDQDSLDDAAWIQADCDNWWLHETDPVCKHLHTKPPICTRFARDLHAIGTRKT